MAYENNINLQLIATADPGRIDLTILNYEWRINNVVQSNNTNILTISTASLPLGDNTLTLRVQNSCLSWSDFINKTITIVQSPCPTPIIEISLSI